jgi:hypothetical protein
MSLLIWHYNTTTLRRHRLVVLSNKPHKLYHYLRAASSMNRMYDNGYHPDLSRHLISSHKITSIKKKKKEKEQTTEDNYTPKHQHDASP